MYHTCPMLVMLKYKVIISKCLQHFGANACIIPVQWKSGYNMKLMHVLYQSNVSQAEVTSPTWRISCKQQHFGATQELTLGAIRR